MAQVLKFIGKYSSKCWTCNIKNIGVYTESVLQMIGSGSVFIIIHIYAACNNLLPDHDNGVCCHLVTVRCSNKGVCCHLITVRCSNKGVCCHLVTVRCSNKGVCCHLVTVRCSNKGKCCHFKHCCSHSKHHKISVIFCLSSYFELYILKWMSDSTHLHNGCRIPHSVFPRTRCVLQILSFPSLILAVCKLKVA